MNTNILAPGLVDHLLRCNSEQILAKSLKHCHCKNLHSIMLLEHPGATIRMFVAEPGHELWKNDFFNLTSGRRTNQSLAFHPHHCDLTLGVFHGWINNLTAEQGPGLLEFQCDRFIYNSQITKGKIGFTKETREILNMKKIGRVIFEGESLFMPASQIHSVYVGKGEWAAWFALEGREDPNYQPVCWSNDDLENADFAGLYEPMTQEFLNYLLSNISK